MKGRNHVQFPVKQLAVRHVIGDGDLVAVHSAHCAARGDPGMAVSAPVSIPRR